jgi:flagellin-like protein
MNMRTRTTRRWRQKGERGVSPIIATILLVAITVVLAAVLYILISGLTKGPGNTPIGTALAVGSVNEATSGTGGTARWYYNVSVQSASGGMTWSAMIFQVQTSAGAGAAGPTTITTTNGAGSCNLATYTFASAAWTVPAANVCTGVTTGGGALVVPGAQIQMISTTNLNNAGNTLVVVGQSSFSGTSNIGLP